MEFKHCSIAGVLYLEGSQDILINVCQYFVLILIFQNYF